MSRRSSTLENLFELPWQISAVLALLCYPGAFLLNRYLSSNPILETAASVPLRLWPWAAGLFGFAALMSFVNGLQKKKLFAQNQSLEKIRNLTWQQFEQFVGQYFKEQGYRVVETPEGPDGGVDLVLRKDGEKTYVQCKHWKANKVGVEKIRALMGSMISGGAQNGILIATGSFTQAAKKLAVQTGIQLLDGQALERAIQPLHGKTSSDEKVMKENTCTCPVCGAPMVVRTAKRGQNAGNEFWGCSNFPACRGTRNF